MRKFKFFVISLFFLFIMSFSSFSKEVPFTQEDRERLIKLETKVDEGFKTINQRIDDTNKRIDDLRDLIYVVLGGMIALIGFVIWDRRTALAPVVKKYRELDERSEKIEQALKELAKRDPKVEEVLRHVGLI